MKAVLCYIYRDPHSGITYNLGKLLPTNIRLLHEYAEVRLSGYMADRKSTTGISMCYNGDIICWTSKKQTIMALSTAEAEYVAMDTTT